jgi:hypothetical protein
MPRTGRRGPVEGEGPSLPPARAEVLSGLPAAIEAYRQAASETPGPDPEAEDAMLAELAASAKAGHAFISLKRDEQQAADLVRECLIAYRLYTGAHRAQLEALRAAPDYEQWLATLNEMRDFLRRREDCRTAIDVLRAATFLSRSFRDDNLRAIGREGDDDSARSRAIGVIKESVRTLSGKAHLKQVATIAGVVLKTKISLDAVKRATTPSKRLKKGQSRDE